MLGGVEEVERGGMGGWGGGGGTRRGRVVGRIADCRFVLNVRHLYLPSETAPS